MLKQQHIGSKGFSFPCSGTQTHPAETCLRIWAGTVHHLIHREQHLICLTNTSVLKKNSCYAWKPSQMWVHLQGDPCRIPPHTTSSAGSLRGAGDRVEMLHVFLAISWIWMILGSKWGTGVSDDTQYSDVNCHISHKISERPTVSSLFRQFIYSACCI